ncbi:MAG: hypothetical protein ACKVRN_01315 [Pyrinomonadaceae bacterium]
MSLTETEPVFASIHEDALNDVLTAFCKNRPLYLVYGSPAFVPAMTVARRQWTPDCISSCPGWIINPIDRGKKMPTPLNDFEVRRVVNIYMEKK